MNTSLLARAVCVAGAAAAVVSCSQSAPTETAQPAPAATAQSAAEAIKAAVPEITRVIPLTEDNDSNNLLGRPNGYTAAVVLVDSRSTAVCDLAKPGADCGATVEQWPDQDAAQRRADYIQGIRASMQGLGTEWTIVKDNLLLRVTGNLTPSVEKAYEAAFKG
jgi:serine/threonine-protein kinase